MQLVDAHCHLECEEFQDCLEEVLADARRAGIAALITCGCCPEQWPQSERIAREHPEVQFAMGVHPWYAKEEHLPELDTLREARERGAVAIGEIGLDRKITSVPFELQWAVFEKQLRIAVELNLPVNMHCRGAYGDLVRAFKTVGLPEAGGIVHAFSGSVEVADELVGYGISFSMGGTLSYRNSKKRARVLERIYPDYFLLETDSPDIPPVESNGKPNVPCNILYALKAASDTLGEPAEAIAAAITANAARIFGLELPDVE